VFAGRVESIEHVGGKGARRFLGSRRVRFRVSEAFRGTSAGAGGEVTVLTGSGGGDCGYPFKEGREYLVYASRTGATGEMTASICSRTRPIEDAASDLEYARAAVAGRAPTGRISGEVRLVRRTLTGGSTPDRQMPDVRVTLGSDSHTASAVTDANGVFSAEGLPAGRYAVAVEAPEGYYAEVFPRTVEFTDPRACADVMVNLSHDGRVSGRIADASGLGVPGLTVELRPPPRLRSFARATAVTGDDGAFELRQVPPGRFVVGINTESREDPSVPPVLYPGVETLARATVFTLGPSEIKSIGLLRLPEHARYVPIRGIVVNAAGEPVAGALVFRRHPGAGGRIVGDAVRSDARGGFVLAAPAGRRSDVFAERSVGEGADRRTEASDPVTASAEAGAAPVRLILRPRY
jgi:hypothetical protein